MFMAADQGTIIKGVGGLYTVYCGGTLYQCSARGIFRKNAVKPLIGDQVVLSDMNPAEKTAAIHQILPRSNALIRPAVANVDQIVLMIAAVSPQPDLLLVDRLLATARLKRIETVLLINKADQDEKKAEALLREYRDAVKCYVICAAEHRGIELLKPDLAGKCTVFAGQSGAGKSTVLNLILGTNVMETGGLSQKTQRGRHTTRHAELFFVSGGDRPTFLIDSPGFSLFSLNAIAPRDLSNLYPEVYNNNGFCRFPDCSHTGEPGCFVAELVKNGIFPQGRYERYLVLYRELAEMEKNKYR